MPFYHGFIFISLIQLMYSIVIFFNLFVFTAVTLLKKEYYHAEKLSL